VVITVKILAIVPAFNEEKNIGGVVESINGADANIDILVVSDGSTDGTVEKARSSGLSRVVNLPCNLGIGGAVQTGFRFARRGDYDIVFQFDGDGQHLASEIEKILAPVQDGRADVVIGSRFCGNDDGYRSTLSRRLGIKVFEVVNSFLIGQKITDNTSGFRAYNRRAIGSFYYMIKVLLALLVCCIRPREVKE